ncbi:MAG: glycoside hydrolase family 99-like domain-containing protein [Burkholderiales bacterium]|nr:glycoside hydrolase family 99-like domain-containing protein [Burkholderiales bacterium]
MKWHWILLLLSALSICHAANTQIGVYYYPGWKDNLVGGVSAHPWEVIKPYPDREPLLGYYAEDQDGILNHQLGMMADNGISFVVFDWYWHAKLGALKTQAIDTYFRVPNRARVKTTILWANHTEFPQSEDEYKAMVRYWLRYFLHSEYLQIDGKPVVFVFSMDGLEAKANAFGKTTADLIADAQAIARGAGFKGIYFVGSTGANNPIFAKLNGTGPYDAITSYNFQGPATYLYDGKRNVSHSYGELDAAYRDQWSWMLSHTSIPFIVPMSSGWDRRPWGGSPDPQHDESRATPREFAAHLEAGRNLILGNHARTLGMGVICCWNEFGEGSFIEPTKAGGDALLRQVNFVFARREGASKNAP